MTLAKLAIKLSGFRKDICVTFDYPDGIKVVEVATLTEADRERFFYWDQLKEHFL